MTEAVIREALTDTQTVAVTLWGEARSEPVDGRIAVGQVIRNRAVARKQTMKVVCLAAKQFSCWNTDDSINHAKVLAQAERLVTGGLPLDAMLRECLFIAQGTLGGAFLDNTKGADHYLTTDLLSSEHAPSWVHAMRITVQLGNHTFLRSA